MRISGPIVLQDIYWTFFIYNSRTTSRILTKFSGMKRSSIRKMIVKFRLPEVVAMETVTHSLFFVSDRYFGRGEAIVLKFWQCVLLEQRYNLCSEDNFLRLIDFLISSSKLWGRVKWMSKRDSVVWGGLFQCMYMWEKRVISVFPVISSRFLPPVGK